MANDPNRVVAFDTEFNNLKQPFIATTCDWKLKTVLYNCHKPKDVAQFREPLEDPSITKIAFPYTVDAHVVKDLGITCRGPWEDPLIAGTLLDENFARRKGLKAMAQHYLHEEILEAKRLTKYKKRAKKKAEQLGIPFDYSLIPKFVMKPYAVQDSVYPIKLWWLFREPIKQFDRIYQFEKKVAVAILKMQSIGMLVDRKFCLKQSMQYTKDIAQCEKEIAAILKSHRIEMPEKLSPKKLLAIFEEMDIVVKNEKGKPTTEGKFLVAHDKIPLVGKILLHRFLKKQKGTYFDPLRKKHTTDDNATAVFFLFSSGARTGRTSAELIQTIPRPDESRTAHAPKLARKAFIPRPGYVFLAVDYKALQMRIFFHFARAKALIEKVKDGWDPHDAACQLLFGQVEKELRKDTKNIQFGIVFGMGIGKLMRSLQNSKAKKNMSQIEASTILDKYYSIVPVKQFNRECTSQLYSTGKLELKFESPLMDFHREYRVPQEMAYKGPNVLIQGTEAYVVKAAMLRCDKKIVQSGMDVNMLMNVHDELLFEVSQKESIPLVVNELVKAMEDHVTLSIPLEVDAKISKTSWGDVVEWTKVKDQYARKKKFPVHARIQ